jgi:hypothetical protein
MLFYRAGLPLSRSTLDYATGVVRWHRKMIGSRGRALTPGRQALLVLVYLRKGETYEQLGAGFGVSTATAWRYVNETVALLSARSPNLDQAVLPVAGRGGSSGRPRSVVTSRAMNPATISGVGSTPPK